ncbi:hypothetical protein [Neobacillus vireti]|uniref:hypothetical protein n=1 Tax=Neobacillus vireti TaxID=220686 RepID=UPI002FFEC6A6
MSGFDSLKNRIILMPEAKMDYSQRQIEKFVEMWKAGKPIGEIADHFWIKHYEVALLVMHCELENLIRPRKGGLYGSVPRKKRYRRKGKSK